MSDPDNPIGYAAAIDSYWQAGWRGILPLKTRSKWPPPDDFTGYNGAYPSYADCLEWGEEKYRDGNLAIRLPNDEAIAVIGIDVDDYGVKTGAKAFAEAIRRWGPLPAAPRSTSREGNHISGIRLFRVPPRTVLETRIHFPELGIGDIEIIQKHHRYVVSWPSIHPEGPTYWWRNDEGQLCGIPAVEDLPWLPQAWIDGLKARPKSEFDGPIDFNIKAALTPGEPSFAVQSRLSLAIKELNTPGASRHDTCTRHVMAIARLGKSGEPGVMQALQLLCDMLVAVRRVDGSNTPEGTRAEFVRMLTNESLARELSQPGFTDWIHSLVVVEPSDPTPANRAGAEVDTSPAEPVTEGNSMAPSDNEGRAVEPTGQSSPLEVLEQGFWESRESLAQIYQTALARMASPWAVLGICAARALTQVRPNVTLPPLIGGPGSLNWFVALVARSGGGKGAANAASNLLIPRHTFKQVTIGSGEGLVKLFDRPRNADADNDVNEAILVNVDEVDTLTALSQRSASTTIAVLKQAFSGESLGFTYVNRANVRDVADHGYRMTLVVSVQPRKSAGLFADEGGGLPQRFMWLPAGDKRIDMAQRWPSTPLTLPAPGEWLYPREIAIPPGAEYTIRHNRMLNAHEELSALDGHALFCREKFAYALAVLDGRVQMTLEDWELSAIAAGVSDYTREGCLADLREAATLDAMERGEVRGVEMEAADIAKFEQEVKRGQKVLNWLLHKLDSAPEGWLGQGELMERCTSSNRKTLTKLLEHGHEALRGEFVEGTIRWSRK